MTTAAVNAPASINPSSAILITPARSENMPPSAANISGVAERIVEKSRMKVKMSVSLLFAHFYFSRNTLCSDATNIMMIACSTSTEIF